MSGYYWMIEVVVSTGATRRAKLQSNHHHQHTNIQLFTGRMPFLSPNQQRQRRQSITFHRLAHLKLTWCLPTLSLTAKGSWLPCGRVARPLVSPLMPVSGILRIKKTARKPRSAMNPLTGRLVRTDGGRPRGPFAFGVNDI